MTIVGHKDATVQESRERVEAAVRLGLACILAPFLASRVRTRSGEAAVG